jgi:transposase
MRAYSLEFRKRVLAMCDKGRTTREVARAFDVSESWVRRIKQVRREQGLLGPLPVGGRRHGHFDAARLSQLEGWLRQHPDATLEWLRARVVRDMELRCSLMGVFRAVRKLGWSLKKKRFERPSKIVRTLRGDA